MVPASCVLLIKNNRILLVKHGFKASHKSGFYGLPGGKVESGESLKEAAVREFDEETGLKTKIDDLKEYPGNEYQGIVRKKEGVDEYNMTVFLCSSYSGSLRSTNETTPYWLEIDKIGEFELLPGVDIVIKDGMKYL